MSRPMTRRAPTKTTGFTWGRFPMGNTGIVCYRLFRRDLAGAVHIEAMHFFPRDQRAAVALALREACHGLRDRVDKIDLAAMGVAA